MRWRLIRRSACGLVVTACLAGVASASLRVPESAYGADAVRDGAARVEARLLVHPDDVPSEPFVRVGVLLDPAPGWHVYWRNPGASGLAPELAWEVGGARVGPVAWPAPARFWESDGELETFGYAERVLLTSEAELVADAAETRIARLDAEVLVCKHECIPASFSLQRVLEPSGDPESDAEERRLFERFARAVPRSPRELGVALEAIYTPGVAAGDAFDAAIAVRPCAGERARHDCAALRAPGQGRVFYPDVAPALSFEVTGVRPHPTDERAWLVTLAGRARDAAPAPGARLRGVLALAASGGSLRHVEVDLPLWRAGAEAGTAWLGTGQSPVPVGQRPSLLVALGFALLGGLVLNLMPCVLPVLAIKVFAVTELASRSRRALRLHGLAYAAGVLVTMLALAVVVIALRRAGASVGWGFQFQEPLFVVAISALLVVFALNLFGVFEIGAPGGRLAKLGAGASGARRSFFEGLLAVVLATPCTAPFLGTAVGLAFAASPALCVAIFAAIGCGLAAPYVIVSWVPAWARFVPRSGAWMLRIRAGLGFALLATVVWLVWVFGRSAGSDGVAALLALLLTLAFATWIYGMLQERRPRWLPYSAALVGAALAVAAASVLRPAAAAPTLGVARGWEPYAPAALAAELASGRPAFVSFTADWCITCKVNERVVLDHERVRDELKRRDFALFRADWTRRDESIRAELARFGRAGVPLYLVYRPTAPDRPVLLPELLTVELVLDALRAPG